MLEKEKAAIKGSSYLNDTEKEMRLRMLGSTDSYFQSVFDEKQHDVLRGSGKLKLSYKATIAALLITLYHEEPILQMPFNLLKRLTEIDENLTTWRYRHAQMVRRMLGRVSLSSLPNALLVRQEFRRKRDALDDARCVLTLIVGDDGL